MVKTSPYNVGGAGLIPGWGAKIPHALGPKTQNIKQEQYCNKFNKEFKNCPHQKILKKKKSILEGIALCNRDLICRQGNSIWKVHHYVALISSSSTGDECILSLRFILIDFCLCTEHVTV